MVSLMGMVVMTGVMGAIMRASLNKATGKEKVF